MRTTLPLVPDALPSAVPASSERVSLHAARDAARRGLRRIAQLAARYAQVPCAQVVFLDPALSIWDLTVGALNRGTAKEETPDAAPLYRDGHLTDRAEVHGDLYTNDRWTALTPPTARFLAGFLSTDGTTTDRKLSAAPRAALCLWDVRARVLHPDQIAFLTDLAATLAEPLRCYQSEAARFRTEARFRRIAEATPDALVLAAPDRTIVGVNPAFERLFGYAPDEVIGETTQMLYARPEDYEEQGRIRYHPDAAEQPQAYEVAYRRSDGALFTSETVGVKIRDGADGFLAMIRDVSEREALGAALAESERHLREVVGNTPIVLWAIDAEGVITLSDGLGLQAMGLEPGQVVGASLFEMYADDPVIVAALRRGLGGAAERWRSQVGDIVYDNQTRPLVEGSEIVGLIGVSLDVTQRERDAAALRAARDEAEAAARLIRAFLANINHELRTPLTGLLGCADWLLHDAPAELQEPLRLIHQSSLRLKTTLDSVLDLARIEAGEMPTTTEQFVPVHTLEAVVTDLHGYADERGIDLRVEAGDALAVCEGAESVLHRIATHLVTNAIKFTDEGEVVVHLAAGDGTAGDGTASDHANDAEEAADRDRPADALVLTVRDTGSGIAPDFLPHVFDAFEQESDGWTRSHDGIGIGLTIAHRLTRLVGGTIAVESTHGVGSTFTATLPCTWRPSVEVPDAMPHHADVFFLDEVGLAPIEAPLGSDAVALRLDAQGDALGGTLPVDTLVTEAPAFMRRDSGEVAPKPSQASPARPAAPPPGPLAQPTSVLVADGDETACSLVGAYLMGICEVHTATTFADALATAEERPFDVLLLNPSLDGPGSAASMLARLRACAGTMDAFTIALTEAGTAPPGFDAVLTKPLDDTDVLLTVGTVLAR